jgi:hypothetical protein
MVRPLLAHLPEAVFAARVARMQHDSVQAIARWVHAHGAPTAADRRAFRATVDDLVECVAAALAAPLPARPRGTVRRAAPAGGRRPEGAGG